MPVASCVPPQIIDTVPMDETTEEMFGYFEPLYEVIHDMPRPPEAFFKRKGGEWETLLVPSASLPSVPRSSLLAHRCLLLHRSGRHHWALLVPGARPSAAP